MIDPTLPSGFRDYLPAEMLQRQRMLDTIRAVYERFGFAPLETPAVERRDVLVSGDSTNIIYELRSSAEEDDAPRDTALRFDLTVPLARVVAANVSTIAKPFRRYQCAKVWRGERPQMGRYREFLQFDADVVGSDDPRIDAELLWLVTETLTALKVERFTLKVNSRKVLDGLTRALGLAPQTPEAVTLLRAIDKLDKIGLAGVQQELAAKLALPAEALRLLETYLALRGTPSEVLNGYATLLGESAEEGIEELRTIADAMNAFGVAPERWRIDPTVIRGLGYYTGMVFETVLDDLPKLGSVYSGGRYDGLVARYSDATFPASGASIGFDRLYAGLQELGLLSPQATPTRVLIIDFDASQNGLYLGLLRDLRAADIPSELYLGAEKAFKGQLAYALKQEIPLVVIAGADEAAKGVVQLKDTRDRSQTEVPVKELVGAIREKLAS